MKQRAIRLLGAALATALLVTACDDEEITLPPPGAPLPFNLTVNEGSSGQLGIVGQPLPDPIVLTATDQFGNVFPSATIEWEIISGPADTALPIDASISASSTTTDAAGESSVIWTLSSVAGFSQNEVEASAVGVTGPTTVVTFTAKANSDVEILTDPAAFATATAGLGTSTTTIDFAGTDPGPHGLLFESIAGHLPFSLDPISSLGVGITISNPTKQPFYIAPAGLSWNASNSLSVTQFPADPSTAFGDSDDDDLLIEFEPGCLAVAFVMVAAPAADITRTSSEFVRILDPSGDFIAQLALPAELATDDDRAFLGIVSDSPLPLIATLVVEEAAGDGIDVAYDDFRCIR